MKTLFPRALLGLLLLTLGVSSILAQQVPEKFTVIQTAGAGVTFTIFGRTFPLKAGDVLPAGSVVNAPSGTNLVVSPALGVLIAVNGGSKVQFVSNVTLLTGKEPATEILINVIFGKVTVNSGPYLSPKSHIAVNTAQGLFSTNNAAFSVASVLINRGGIQSSVGGVEVDSGKLRASLASGEELGVSAGQNLVGRMVGNNLTRAITNGKLPDTLVDFVPGEREVRAGSEILSMSGGFASERDAINLANAMSDDIEKLLFTTSVSSIPALLLTPFSSDEKILFKGQEIGMNGEPILPDIEGALNTATNDLILQQMSSALGLNPKVGAGNLDSEAGPPNIRQLLTQISQSTGGDAAQQLGMPIPLILAPNFTSPQSTTGKVGTTFTYQFTTDDPTATIRIDQGSLPPWLTINGTTISGIPPAAGNYAVRATAFNVSGLSTPFITTIMVSPLGSPVISITQSPAGNLTVGNSYTFTINVQAPYPYDLSESGLPSWLSFPTVTNSNATTTSVTVTIPSSAAATSGTIFATATHTGGPENATAMLDYTVNPIVSTQNISITLATVGTQNYLTPTGANTSADLNTISSPLPGMDIATFDALVTNPAFGNGGLYWPWTSNALGQSLLQNGFKPDGDVFAAFYVYTHYKTIAGVVTFVSGGISDGSGITTPGTYTGPGSTFSYDPTNLTIFP